MYKLNLSCIFSTSDICEKDWLYFRGYCYRKVAPCSSWTLSQGACAIQGANLPSIHSQEENVFVQSLHGGEKSWLGLSDINTEGTFVWTDGTNTDFYHWASHQPNNFGNQDCVHTLGFLQNHDYEWNDINCTDCHRFTCKKGKFNLYFLFSCNCRKVWWVSHLRLGSVIKEGMLYFKIED